MKKKTISGKTLLKSLSQIKQDAIDQIITLVKTQNSLYGGNNLGIRINKSDDYLNSGSASSPSEVYTNFVTFIDEYGNPTNVAIKHMNLDYLAHCLAAIEEEIQAGTVELVESESDFL